MFISGYIWFTLISIAIIMGFITKRLTTKRNLQYFVEREGERGPEGVRGNEGVRRNKRR